MTTTKKKHWGVLACVVAGAIFVCAGFWLAALSNPRRFSLAPTADAQIHLLAASGATCIIAGTVLLLAAGIHTTKSMSPEKRAKTNAGVGIGIGLQLAGLYLAAEGEVRALLGLLLILISVPVFIWGCMNYAEGKGQSKWVGIVGLLGIIGLIVLIALPDQHEETS